MNLAEQEDMNNKDQCIEEKEIYYKRKCAE
jgi:hypothetical protein